MRALVPAGSESPAVALGEVDDPRPGDHEAVISVEAFAINRGETFLLEDPEPGWRPGKDVAGTIVHAAANGEGPPIGSRVLAHPDSAGWAERVAVPVAKLATLPAGIEPRDAAALPLAGLTALRLLRATGGLASRRVLLTGASGGVGHYFVELGAAQGAEITAVCASRERGERLLALGASGVVADVEHAAGPFDVGLDSVGAASTAAVLRRVREGGLMIWFGQASRVAPRLDFFDWSGGWNLTIRKFHYAQSRFPDAVDLATLVRLLAAGRLHPEIGFEADWSRAQEGLEALLARKVRGNVVLTVGAGKPTNERK